MATFAAVDLGAQSGRVALGRFDGRRIEVTETHRFPNQPVRAGGTLHWDVLRLYRESLDGLRAAARAARIDSVAVDSWAVDFGLVDRRGRLLGNPVHYRDGRRGTAVDEVLARVPARELYERTGIQLLPINTLFELAAMAFDRAAALDAADSLLMIPDLFHRWLCGSRTTEFTNSTTTQCFDPRRGTWAEDLLERVGIPTRVLPEVVPAGTVLGRLDPEVADETGLAESTEVVAVATHDTGSAIAAIPFRRADSAFLSVGTWSLVGVEVAEPVITDASFEANLTNEGCVGGTFRLLRNVTGLWLLHECRRAWAGAGDARSFEELVELARTAPPFGPFVDPDDPSFSTPGDMPVRIADFCARTGQPEPEGQAGVVRCILESLALKHAEAVDAVARTTGREPAELHLVGGGSRNELLCDWTAQAAGRPVLAGPEEATLLGSLLVQAMGRGELASLEELREVVRASFEPRVFEPAGAAEWSEARERFADLAGAEVTA